MSQIKIVKGNDAPIQWRVSYQGQPLDLTGKAVTLYVINSRGPFQLKSFEVEGNVVTATYYGADQTRFGEHSLVLRLNEGRSGMSTVAVKEAFELVEWSKDQGGESGEPIKVTPIILEADVAVAPRADVDLSNYYTKDEANAAFQPKGNYQPAGNYASTSELTELSTEVSGLSERVDELEQGGSSVFEAIYGTTTYEEIVEAYVSNKHCICRIGNNFLSLVEFNYKGGDKASFSAIVGDTQHITYCLADNSWGQTFFKFEKTANKVTSLSDKSTDTQYPSAKAVYDFVNNAIGNVINGEY